MGIFIGCVEKKGSEPTIFLNFKPLVEVNGRQFLVLSQHEQEELLPESEKRNISFSFSWNDLSARRQIDEFLGDNALVAFDFQLSDLYANTRANGERYPTGYKVPALEMIETGKIKRIDTFGIYHVIRQSELLSNFANDAIVEIDSPGILAGNKVFVEWNDHWVGPYEVGYREYTSSFYIKPQIKENKYSIKGFKRNNVTLSEVSSTEYWGAPEKKWLLLTPQKDAVPEQIDLISDEVLLESFRDSLDNSTTCGQKVCLDDIPSLLTRYEESFLAGSSLTPEVRNRRLNRLVSILTSEADVDDTLSTITDFICDLLIKYQNSQNVEEWLRGLLEKNPGLIDHLKESQAIADRIAQVEQNLAELQQKRGELEQEITKKKAEADEIDKAAIEAKKRELLQMDAEYTVLCNKLENVKKSLDIVGDVSELHKRHAELQDEVSYLDTHKTHLERDTNGLELQFQQLISKPHEKMVNIAFDGFMASKMLHAAAQWEAEAANHQHEALVTKVANLPTSDKTPEELLEYLCKTVQLVRPTYSKNTIINIAICLTQGFLTVFSGEPGCGKTSICNIFADALGLNKLSELIDVPADIADSVNRYVPVSVERGWTSKRDFVGYFNPLSKTFDKSNRRIYDALHQLDTEKQANKSNLPYVVLLDEANLSPMEYYWSDFMNICDDLGPQSKVNLGEDYVFGIPETLHFFATINNDHTTETLSPRLIDRAWIIVLPQQHAATFTTKEIPSESIEIITWKSLCAAFAPQSETCALSTDIQRIYDAVYAKLREMRFIISPRIDRAIKRYWAVASKRFEMDETRTGADIVAIDYAIAQRILPKISGSGEAFEKWLEEFRSLCSSHDLNMSAKILKDIIDRGNHQMKYFQFFC